ncbi:MAG TPA: VIT domain-containing protein [Chloroflexota bacterium]|nr:VIT domain-containing protein [Chloroflexota bacterium]
MFNPNAYENSRPGGVSLLQIVDDRARFVPLKRTELHGEIAGPLASLRLIQVFGYTKEQCDRVLEAIYRFPLPGDAAVSGVLVRFGEVEIQATLAARKEAEATYQEAQRQGRQAALLTREASGVFSLRVSGLVPDQQITIETTYVQLARAEDAGWSLRLPLTTAPRYVREDEATAAVRQWPDHPGEMAGGIQSCPTRTRPPDEAGARAAQGQPLLLLRDPGHLFTLDLSLQGAGAARSATHALQITREDDALRVRLRDGHVVPDRDFVLSWQPRQEQRRPALQVWTYEDPASAQLYFLATVAPPAVVGPVLSREVILLVDHSGSMEGPKWAAADWAVKQFLSGLSGEDSFNLGVFHDTTRWFAGQPCTASPDTIARAIGFLEQHRDSGGTNLGVALEQALHLDRRQQAHSRHVLVITDAQVTDEARILRLADQEWGRTDRRRISVLCIDAAPNSFLAGELAERGGGVARFLTSAPEEEDITTALDAVLADWAQPVLADLQLVVNRPAALAGGRHVRPANDDASAIDLGDLPAGRTLWVAGRAARDGASAPIFRLVTPDDQNLATSGATTGMPAAKALFGARQVLALDYLINAGYSLDDLAEQLGRLGYDPRQALGDRSGTPPAVYAENARAAQHALLGALLAREALAYGLASTETAFVAVRREQGQVVEDTVPVANALPAGWSDAFLTGSAPRVAMSAAYMLAAPSQAAPGTPPTGALYRMASLAEPSQPFAQAPASGGRQGWPRRKHAARMQAAPPPPAVPHTQESAAVELFTGVPRYEDGGALLFDSIREEESRRLPVHSLTLTMLRVQFPDGTQAPESIDPRLSLLLFVDDMAAPRARVRLLDMVRQGGARPLNIARAAADRVRLVLDVPAGAWPASSRLTVRLEWRG